MTSRRARAAVVFDFDGTLVDSTDGILTATNQLLIEERRRPLTREELDGMLGGGAPRLIERAFGRTGGPPADADAAVGRWRMRYDLCAPQGTALFPGVLPLLSKLAADGLALGVCTSKPHASTLSLLQALGVGRFFGAVLGGDSTPDPKPHPGHLLAVLADLDVKPSDAIMVGDSAHDFRMARAAGVRSVHVTQGDARARRDEPAPDWTVDCIRALGPVLDAFLRRTR